MVTAEIPECSEEFRYRWRESGTRKESKSVGIPSAILKEQKVIVTYSAIQLESDLIRKETTSTLNSFWQCRLYFRNNKSTLVVIAHIKVVSKSG